MAKWGEGDERWIVDERLDGKNVGSWHWEDISKIKWSKERLTELLTGLDAGIPATRATLSITEVKSITGEVRQETSLRLLGSNMHACKHAMVMPCACCCNIWHHCCHLQASITQRKGNKRFPLFDLVILAKYEGMLAGSDKPVRAQGAACRCIIIGPVLCRCGGTCRGGYHPEAAQHVRLKKYTGYWLHL